MSTLQRGSWSMQPQFGLTDFDIEISWGSNWISLNDHVSYRVSGDTFSDRSQTRRRQTVNSVFYDGTYETHSVLENIQETVGVYILGSDQNVVTEGILALEDYFGQSVYNLRVSQDNHRETWLCQPAEWTTDRAQVNAHNIRATMKFAIPRFPKVTYEVIS